MYARAKGVSVEEGTVQLLRMMCGQRATSRETIPFQGLASADREYPLRRIVDAVMPDASYVATAKSHHGKRTRCNSVHNSVARDRSRVHQQAPWTRSS